MPPEMQEKRGRLENESTGKGKGGGVVQGGKKGKFMAPRKYLGPLVPPGSGQDPIHIHSTMRTREHENSGEMGERPRRKGGERGISRVEPDPVGSSFTRRCQRQNQRPHQ